jgi:hypothetical protein
MAGIAIGAGVPPPGNPGAPLNADGSGNQNAVKEQADHQQAYANSEPNSAANQAHGNAPGVLGAVSSKPARKNEITPPGGSQSGPSNLASEAARALANHRHAKTGTAADKDATPDVRELAGSEIRAYRKWARTEHSRPFEFVSPEMLVKVMAPAESFEDATFKQAADAPSHAARHDVHAEMSESFPPEAIDWVKHADWAGPKHVSADQIDMSDQNSWAAHHDPQKVAKIANKLRKGKKAKPVILVRVKGKQRYIAVDGHHHLLGSIKAGVIPTAYVGEIDPQYLAEAMETHTKQYPKNDKAGVPDQQRALAMQLGVL